MKEIEKENSQEVAPPPVKGLESLKWTRFTIQLQDVGDKVLLGHRVPIKEFQPDKMKDLNAHIATNTILAFADE